MLRAFKDHLKELSKNKKDKFSVHIRKKMGKKGGTMLEGRLRQLVLLMPDIVARIYRLWAEQKTPSEVKRTGGFLLTYLYQTKDFLSADEHGLFGYLDDAYLTASVYEEVLKELEENNISVKKSDKEFLETIQPMRKAARIILPKETGKIDKMLSEIIKGEQKIYETAFE
jgi:uncharacterized membrane protein YkvA (DUF1232 family)